MAACGRSCRFAFEIERQLCEPLPTKPLKAAKRRYVPLPTLAGYRLIFDSILTSPALRCTDPLHIDRTELDRLA